LSGSLNQFFETQPIFKTFKNGLLRFKKLVKNNKLTTTLKIQKFEIRIFFTDYSSVFFCQWLIVD